VKDVLAVIGASVALAAALTAAVWVTPVVRLDWWDIAIGAWLLAYAVAWSFVLATGRGG
jgi:hypothetical protein